MGVFLFALFAGLGMVLFGIGDYACLLYESRRAARDLRLVHPQPRPTHGRPVPLMVLRWAFRAVGGLSVGFGVVMLLTRGNLVVDLLRQVF